MASLKRQFRFMIVVIVKILLLSSLLTIACRGRKEFTRPGYIIGPTNDIERLADIDFANLEIDDEILEFAKKSSVLVVTTLGSGQSRFCSGSLVEAKEGKDLPRIVTNHHCFAKKEEGRDRSLPELIPEACKKTSVYFTAVDEASDEDEKDGASETSDNKYLKRGCLKDTLQTNYGADLAIFTIKEKLPENSYEPFEIWEGAVPANRQAFIIHHPSAEKAGDEHEENSQEQIGKSKFPSKAITDKNCQVFGRFEPELWDQNPNLPFGLRHTCDLVKGSSGSGLIDAETGQLLGVNWGGITFEINNVERKDNVASSAEFLEQFINEEKVDKPVAPEKKDDLQWLCGVVGGQSPLTSTLLIILPALVACLRRRN